MWGLQVYLAPERCYRVIRWWIPVMGVICGCAFAIGLYGGLISAPADYQQGDAFRIIYIHVPAAILSLSIYTIIMMCGVTYLIWRVKVANWVAEASLGIGAMYAFLALATGSLWGKPMWGTWWIWDARLTSELLLFFLYLGQIVLRDTMPTPEQAAKAASIVAIVGWIDVPIIHFSVEWWQTLHQGATISKLAKPSMPMSMLWPLLTMLAAFFSFYLWQMMLRLRTTMLRAESDRRWVKKLSIN